MKYFKCKKCDDSTLSLRDLERENLCSLHKTAKYRMEINKSPYDKVNRVAYRGNK